MFSLLLVQSPRFVHKSIRYRDVPIFGWTDDGGWMIGGRRSVISRWWEIGTSRCQTQKTPAPAAKPCSTDPTDNSRSNRSRRNTRDLAGLVRRGGSGREAMQNAFARPIVEHLITRRKHCIVVSSVQTTRQEQASSSQSMTQAMCLLAHPQHISLVCGWTTDRQFLPPPVRLGIN